jgi:hypothetical protein
MLLLKEKSPKVILLYGEVTSEPDDVTLNYSLIRLKINRTKKLWQTSSPSSWSSGNPGPLYMFLISKVQDLSGYTCTLLQLTPNRQTPVFMWNGQWVLSWKIDDKTLIKCCANLTQVFWNGKWGGYEDGINITILNLRTYRNYTFLHSLGRRTCLEKDFLLRKAQS